MNVLLLLFGGLLYVSPEREGTLAQSANAFSNLFRFGYGAVPIRHQPSVSRLSLISLNPTITATVM